MPSAQPLYGWPDDDGATGGLVTPVSLALLASRVPGPFLFAIMLHHLWSPALAARPASHSRSPPRTLSSPDSESDSPRIGRWRPDQARPLSRVVSSSRIRYRILCPFRGWSQPEFGTTSTSPRELAAAMHAWCSIWALFPILQGSTQLGEIVMIPGGIAPLADTLVYSPGQVQTRLVPRVSTLHRLRQHLGLDRLLNTVCLRLPPALQYYTQHPDFVFHLRDGDSFELFHDAGHPLYRPGVPVPTLPLCRLPHLCCWHTPFRLEQGGWVTVWDPYSASHPPCESRWVNQGAVWSPNACQFQRPNRRTAQERWIPAAWVDDAQCHFVRQSEAGSVCVLQTQLTAAAPIDCIVLPVIEGEATIPEGWMLRSDLQARSSLTQLRDGDVIVPTDAATRRRVQHLHDDMLRLICAASATFHKRIGIIALLLLAARLPLAQGMVHAENLITPPSVRVGMYAWRVPEQLRLCDATVDEGSQAVLISPFTGSSEPTPVHPDVSVEELHVSLAGPEPAWAESITPVWPAVNPHQLTFLPTQTGPSLVVLLVVAPQWQAAYLMPARADANWILATLRAHQCSLICGVRPPLAALKHGASASTAVDWRDGDVIFVTPLSSQEAGYYPPVFSAQTLVRHSALWVFDFIVHCKLNVTVWRPGLRPTRTTMPPPSRWLAASQTFAGAFSRKYPGRWVPVPWIYNDEVHLCQRAPGEDDCNIILEALRDNFLDGSCIAVHTWTTVASIASQLGIPADRISLLGPQPRHAPGALRDGDILHYTAPSEVSRAPRHGLVMLAFLPVIRGATAARGVWSALLLASIWSFCLTGAYAAPFSPQSDHCGVPHCVWSPFTGKLAYEPVEPAELARQLQEGEPWWPSDLVRVQPPNPGGRQHWVPCSPCSNFAVVLVLGPPAPRAILLPRVLRKSDLLAIFRRTLSEVWRVKGRLPQLADHVPHASVICLRDGDILVTQTYHWQPSICGTSSQSFASHVAARVEGLWSHALDFVSDCWLMLWRPPSDSPIAIYASGTQRWDPHARTLHPALSHLPDSWWPSIAGSESTAEPLHLIADTGDQADTVNVLSPDPWRCLATCSRQGRYRTGDVMHTMPGDASPTTNSDAWRPTPVLTSTPDTSDGVRYGRPFTWALLIALTGVTNLPFLRTCGGIPWSLVFLGCYLAAYGAPRITVMPEGAAGWTYDMTAVASLTARLHEYWWLHPLSVSLPSDLSLPLRYSWDAFPRWTGGVPSSLLIATDGSGQGGGSWAFAAWAFDTQQWHCVGWAAASLADTPWIPHANRVAAGTLASYIGELAALESAGLWLAAQLDFWQLHMGSRPNVVTLAIDNAAALQSTAGNGLVSVPIAALARQTWQAVQSRINTRFCHVHSHTGLFANSVADALAENAASGRRQCVLPGVPPVVSSSDMQDLFPYLWMIPSCRIKDGVPVFQVRVQPSRSQPEEDAPTVPLPDTSEAPASLPIHSMTANIQTIKDATPSIFNPSGLAARRQYLYSQAITCKADVICIQEARSRPGRWSGPGLLTWRSGAHKGQYGCEIWLRSGVVDPPLHLNDCKILHSSPRILCISCAAARFPVTIISAHAPHADRPDREATAFWGELTALVRRTTPNRALILGLDANGDLHAADDDECLIGDLLATGEPDRNDDLLLQLCLVAGLEAPGTDPVIQLGEGWSWQHTSGRRKRLDHLLFRPGPWSHHRASQAFDFDIVNATRDHVALRIHSTLVCPRHRPLPPKSRRPTPAEISDLGGQVWRNLQPAGESWQHRNDMTAALLTTFRTAASTLPAVAPFKPRQPYLHQSTVAALIYLKDLCSQIRTLQKGVSTTLLRAAWSAWRHRPVNVHFTLYQQRLVLGAYWLHERDLQRRVHDQARKDKLRHFQSLTATALSVWHSTGQPMQAILHLKWASRRSADRRAVYAAGGYNIEAELEEQFRMQEGGLQVSAGQLEARLRSWEDRPTESCVSALPTLLDIEQCCLRQQPGKAPGPDQIPNEVWRANPPRAGRWLWQLCTQAALCGREPKHFKKALQCALYKKGPASLPANYRSIALLNGIAKIWHSHLRSTLGASVIRCYDDLQLGGRKRIPVSFAVATFRNIWDLGVQCGHCTAALFIDIQAAYYETSRTLLFQGDPELPTPTQARISHLAQLTQSLAHQGALAALGTPADEVALLLDCVSCSHWQLVGSQNVFLATRGSRPGDGLADVLFGALFSVALRHIRHTCQAEGIVHSAAGSFIGRPDSVVPVGWADDLAVLADFPTPRILQAQLPRLVDIVVSTLEHLRFRVNLGIGKTEILLDIRGPQARQVRSELLQGPEGQAWLPLPDGRHIRISPEYRYLGVIQRPRDTGRRDQELCTQRGQSSWAQARSLLASKSLPRSLRRAWIASRILPAAYATLATSIGVSARAVAPLEGFFDRATRSLVSSWQFGHLLTKPSLQILAGLTAPHHATILARVRLVTQLIRNAPDPVWDIFEASWNRATPWADLLIDACRQVWPALTKGSAFPPITLALVRAHTHQLVNACKHLSKYGTAYWAFLELWRSLGTSRSKLVLGQAIAYRCPVCSAVLPSKHALAAHCHRKHSVVNFLTRFTNGTACLWCHTDHFSTDRLKYHLRTSRSCMRGLRVVVGESYHYGSGSKRSGVRHHCGLPPLRLQGPLNASPAQRAASLDGRAATTDELQRELEAVAGVSDEYSWPVVPSMSASHEVEPAPRVPSRHTPSPLASFATPRSSDTDVVAPGLRPSPDQSRWWRFTADRQDGALSPPSPFWPGLQLASACLGLPRSWHQFWPLWAFAAFSKHPWHQADRPAQRLLRASQHGLFTADSAGSSTLLATTLVAATVTFRQACACVLHRGLLWIPGVPSSVGLRLLRHLLPNAVFHILPHISGRVFVAAHPTFGTEHWKLRFTYTADLEHSQSDVLGLFLQPSLIYHAGPLGGSFL